MIVSEKQAPAESGQIRTDELALSLPMFPDDAVPRTDSPPNAAGAQPQRKSVSQPAPPEATGAQADFDLHLLALGRVRGVGVQALRALIDHYGDLARVWQDDVPRVRDVLATARIPEAQVVAASIHRDRRALLDAASEQRTQLRRAKVTLLSAQDPRFPASLRIIPARPYWLFVQGDPGALQGPPVIAIVGTRTASQQGILAAERLADITIQVGLSIVSGLAEGIDHAAHRVATSYGIPHVAVLGTGINVVFPSSTARLRQRMVEIGGAVVTEYLPDDSYSRWRFVDRNRIQAGLAAAVCPVEGRARSGTAHTVRFAEQLDRPLFGVMLHSPNPNNELLDVLRRRGRQVFDLGSDEGRGALDQYLGAIPGDRRKDPAVRDPAVVFADVLKQLDDTINIVGADPFAGKWLLSEIARRFRLPAGGERAQ